MTNITKLAGAAVAALVLTTSFAQAFQSNRIDTTTQHVPVVRAITLATCEVTGSPSEFPDDIAIFNKGNTMLKAGTKVQWSVPFSGDNGTYVLVADLSAGKGVFVPGVLPGGVEAGKECKAKL